MNQWSFIDAISIVSFLVGLQNLEMNITQEDMQKTEDHLAASLRAEVTEIHRHLTEQDEKIDRILEVLK